MHAELIRDTLACRINSEEVGRTLLWETDLKCVKSWERLSNMRSESKSLSAPEHVQPVSEGAEAAEPKARKTQKSGEKCPVFQQ